MVDVRRTFTVDKPVKIVVEYLKDFGNAEQWDPGTQKCTRTDGDGPIAVGATWDNVSHILGKDTELTYRLTELTDNHIVLVGSNKTATSTDDITIKPTADLSTSEITYHSHVELHGAAKLGAPVMKVEMERLGVKTEEKLRAAIAAL